MKPPKSSTWTMSTQAREPRIEVAAQSHRPGIFSLLTEIFPNFHGGIFSELFFPPRSNQSQAMELWIESVNNKKSTKTNLNSTDKWRVNTENIKPQGKIAIENLPIMKIITLSLLIVALGSKFINATPETYYINGNIKTFELFTMLVEPKYFNWTDPTTRGIDSSPRYRQ